MRGARLFALLIFSVTAASCSSSSKPGTGTAASTGSTAASTLPETASPTTRPAVTTPDSDAGLGSYLPLYPFASAAAAAHWQSQSADQQWHLDAGRTALEFASWLGYANVNAVIAVKSSGSDAFVSVGFHPNGRSGPPMISAVVHEVKWGRVAGSPWEVVGTQDTTFSIETPRYGSTVASPVEVGGQITGVGENIGVTAQQLPSPSPVGNYCCVSVSGTSGPWSARIPLTAPSAGVLTIAAQAGDEPTEVERFTVTGVRIAS